MLVASATLSLVVMIGSEWQACRLWVVGERCG
jgi:hypothetical protein